MTLNESKTVTAHEINNMIMPKLDKTFENYGISDGIKKQRQIASNSSLPILSKALILLRSQKVEHRGIEPLTSRLRIAFGQCEIRFAG